MSEITNELIYEVPKAIPRDVSDLKHGQAELNAALVAMRTCLVGLHQDVNNLYASIGRQEDRLARIERRLEISEIV